MSEATKELIARCAAVILLLALIGMTLMLASCKAMNPINWFAPSASAAPVEGGSAEESLQLLNFAGAGAIGVGVLALVITTALKGYLGLGKPIGVQAIVIGVIILGGTFLLDSLTTIILWPVAILGLIAAVAYAGFYGWKMWSSHRIKKNGHTQGHPA